MFTPNLSEASAITFRAPVRQQETDCALDELLLRAGARARVVAGGEALLVGGARRCSLFLVRNGLFKLCMASDEGRERISGFRIAGDLLGVDNWGLGRYGCSAVAIEAGEVLEIPARLVESDPRLQAPLAAAVARELHSACAWDQVMAISDAEQRVAAFLLDLAGRYFAASLNPWELSLRAFRGHLGDLLGLSNKDIALTLAGLSRENLIVGDQFEVEILDIKGLRQLLEPSHV